MAELLRIKNHSKWETHGNAIGVLQLNHCCWWLPVCGCIFRLVIMADKYMFFMKLTEQCGYDYRIIKQKQYLCVCEINKFRGLRCHESIVFLEFKSWKPNLCNKDNIRTMSDNFTLSLFICKSIIISRYELTIAQTN